MFHRILIPAIVMSASAFAADLTTIPFNDAAGKQSSLKEIGRASCRERVFKDV